MRTINVTPQLRTVARHFKHHKTLTNVEAHAVYGIRSISSRVAELVNHFGMPIAKDFRKDATGQRYVRYTMVPVLTPSERSTLDLLTKEKN